MDKLGLIYEILSDGLLDARVSAHEGEMKMAFDLVDLFHSIPSKLNRERIDGTDYSETLAWLRMRAEQKKLSRWLDSKIQAAAPKQN